MKPLSDVGFTGAGEFIANEPAYYWPSALPCIISIGLIGPYHWLLRLLISIEAFARAVGERTIDRVLQLYGLVRFASKRIMGLCD